jgi:large subunit ribosomal protein L18e
MPVAFRQKNPELRRVIVALRRAAHANGAPLWGAVADRLERSRHPSRPVNVGQLERIVEADQTVVIPGKLLSDGPISKPITVAVFACSPQAMAKVRAAGGHVLTIPELIQARPDGAGVRLLA